MVCVRGLREKKSRKIVFIIAVRFFALQLLADAMNVSHFVTRCEFFGIVECRRSVNLSSYNINCWGARNLIHLFEMHFY